MKISIFLFATDKETLELAQSLGMTAYFDERVSVFFPIFLFLLLLTDTVFQCYTYLTLHCDFPARTLAI